MNTDIQNINNGFIKRDNKKIYSSLLSYINNNREKIRFQKHPLGFKYFKLDKIIDNQEFRLHFWINTNENQDDDLQIHDHSFHFESFVVYGSIKNTIFITRNNDNSNGFIYDVKFRNEKSRLILNSKNQLLEKLNFEIIETGNFYKIKSTELHKSECLKELTVSLLKIVKPKNKVARVYSSKELNRLSNFERSFVSEDENLNLLNLLINKIKSGKSTVAN